MKLLLIYTHPQGDSFNQALKDSFISGCDAAGHSVDLIDLYEDGFDPVLSSEALKKPLESVDISAFQKRIKAADCLAFIFPIWWFREPAMLAGFIDRVFTTGFAYKYVNGRPVGLLPVKKAVVIETYGGPGFYYYLTGNSPWRRFKRVLKFCGMRTFWHQPCFSVPFTTDKKRKLYLKTVADLAFRLK